MYKNIYYQFGIQQLKNEKLKISLNLNWQFYKVKVKT